jgi:NitT/TauT family transport system substrate-binding protein
MSDPCRACARAAVTTALCLVAAMATAPLIARAQSDRPPEKITFLLDFTPYGKHAPFFAALDKGFWKDAGFDVTIVKGEGSATTTSSYAAGAVDFAFADTPTLILARAKGFR